MRWRLQTKVTLFLGLLLALTCGAALVSAVREQESSMMLMVQEELSIRATQLANWICRDYEMDDERGLQSFVENAQSQMRDVLDVSVIDTAGRVVASTNRSMIDRRATEEGIERAWRRHAIQTHADRTGAPWTLNVLTPVAAGSGAVARGVLSLTVSLEDIQTAQGRNVRRQILVFVCALTAGLLGMFVYMRRGIVGPIRDLACATQRIVAGEFSPIPARKSGDEIAELIGSFNWMAGELRKSREYLEDYNRTLMQMVAAEQDRNQLDRVISSIAHALIEIDNHGNICRWNRAATDIFGLPLESVLGRPLRDSGIPWDWRQVAGLVDGSLDDNQSWHRDAITYTRPDGAPGYLTLTMSRVETTDSGSDGTHSVYVLLAADVTQRKLAEGKVASYTRTLNTINRCRNAIVRASDESALLQEVCQILVDVSGYRLVWVGLTENDQRKGLRPVASAGDENGYLQKVNVTWGFGERGLGAAARAIRSGNPQVVRDFAADADFSSVAGELATRGSLAAIILPLAGDHGAIGTLSLYASEPTAFESSDELKLLAGLADDLAHGMNAMRARAESRRAETQTKASKARLQNILDGASDAIISINEKQQIIQFNRQAERIFGFRPEEILDRSLSILLPERFVPTHAQFAAQFVAGEISGRAMIEFRPLFGRRKNGDEFPIEVSISKLEILGETICTAIIRDVTERQQAEAAQGRLAAAVEQASESIIITDAQGAIQYVNPAFEWSTGLRREQAVGRTAWSFFSAGGHPSFEQDLQQAIQRGKPWSGRLIIHSESGKQYHEDATVTPICDSSGKVVSFVWVGRDITQQMALESQLHQAQKLEAVGSLAAGIAHEINTPIQFVGDNVRFLSDSFGELTRLLQRTDELVAALGDHPQLSARVKEFIEARQAADLSYLKEEVPRAVEQTLDGVARVAKIVRAMKDFSHPDQGEKGLADLNRALQSTLIVAHNELKYVADIVTDFENDLPGVMCHLSDLNQVFLNLLVNSAHAITGSVGDGGGEKGTITVTTRRVESSSEPGKIEGVTISVSDTGTGIPEVIRDRVFEQFFTTKEVGRGTGQGLAIARAVVVEKHGGRIWFDSEVGKGTTFHVYLPVGAEELVEAT